ncbi:transposase [Vibrio sp.]|uniref:transposase n=1 Tax=Vibrio sp. TaxID=678 RepID=UPI00311DAF20
MTTARNQLISTEATSYYHCVSRCVRRSFLCGEDNVTQKNYEHRRDWIVKKIHVLSRAYCIDICAYAIMSNHYHLVVHINKDRAIAISPREVVERWSLLHKLPLLIQKWINHDLTSKLEEEKCLEIIEQWRECLWNLSWYMKELNFDIACRANLEDKCTGHFWESRFKSQALLDEKALAAAMAYVDLNPIRAGIADKPETSTYTSVKARIDALEKHLPNAPCLHPFVGNPTNIMLEGIPFRLKDYLELVDWTARHLRPNKASMDSSLPPIFQRLGCNIDKWLKVCTSLENKKSTAIGSKSQAVAIKPILNKQRIHCYFLE